jgi:hypothetical protein
VILAALGRFRSKQHRDNFSDPRGNDGGHRFPILGRVETEAPTAQNQLTLQTIRDLREVENLREVWKYWQTTRDSDIDFFSGMVRSRGESCRPHVILLSRNARPDALLVGLRDRRRVPLRLCSATLRQSEVNVLEFVYGGLLGNASKENCATLVQAVMRSLAEGDADVALWEQLDVHSALYACAVQLPSLTSRAPSHSLQDHWFMRFPKDLDAFFASLGHRQRHELRRKYKRVLTSFPGRIQVRTFRTIADLEQALPDMERIAGKSAKRQVGFGFFDTPPVREQLRAEAAKGWLRIYVLHLDGSPVAFWKGTLYGRCLQADFVGYDQSWSIFSPGTFLFLKILEDLRHEDIEDIDFGCGNGQLCHSFGNVRRPEASVRICALKLSALQWSLLHALTDYATIMIRGTPYLNWARRAVWKRRQAKALLAGVDGRGRHPTGLQPKI